jgi:hypothetical protein
MRIGATENRKAKPHGDAALGSRDEEMRDQATSGLA